MVSDSTTSVCADWVMTLTRCLLMHIWCRHWKVGQKKNTVTTFLLLFSWHVHVSFISCSILGMRWKRCHPPHGEAYLIVRNPRAQPISSGWRLHQWTWKPGVTTSNYLSSTWVHQWHTGLFWCSILSGLMSVKQQSKKKNYPPRQELKMHLIMHSTVWLTAHGA